MPFLKQSKKEAQTDLQQLQDAKSSHDDLYGGYGDQDQSVHESDFSENDVGETSALSNESFRPDESEQPKHEEAPVVAKKSSNTPYIAAAAVMTLAFGGFAAIKFMGSGSPVVVSQQAGVTMQPLTPVEMPPMVPHGNVPTAGIPVHSVETMQGAIQPGLSEDGLGALTQPGMAPVAQVGAANIADPGQIQSLSSTAPTGPLPAEYIASPVDASAHAGQPASVAVEAAVAHQINPAQPPASLPQTIASTPQGQALPQQITQISAPAASDSLVISQQPGGGQSERLVTLEARMKEAEERNIQLQKQVSEMLELLKGLREIQNAQLAQQQEAAKKATKKPTPKPAPVAAAPAPQRQSETRPITKLQPAPQKKAEEKIDYRLFAIRSDKAWLRAPDGSTVIVVAGDTLKGAGKVVEVSVNRGAVIFAGGKKIEI